MVEILNKKGKMKFKLSVYDDDKAIIGCENLDIRDEELVYEKLGELGDKLAKKYLALSECESCYAKVQEFSDRIPDKNICQECANNMENPLNMPCNE